MRNLFIIGMLLVGAFMAGWFKVNRDGERTTIEINRTEIRSDARKAINRGREILDRHENEYAGQQRPSDDSAQSVWPHEQVATQLDAWGQAFDPRQQPYDAGSNQAQPYDNPNYYPPNQAAPYQQGGQPSYPPVTR